jgi:hypothetical protein
LRQLNNRQYLGKTRHTLARIIHTDRDFYRNVFPGLDLCASYPKHCAVVVGRSFKL